MPEFSARAVAVISRWPDSPRGLPSSAVTVATENSGVRSSVTGPTCVGAAEKPTRPAVCGESTVTRPASPSHRSCPVSVAAAPVASERVEGRAASPRRAMWKARRCCRPAWRGRPSSIGTPCSTLSPGRERSTRPPGFTCSARKSRAAAGQVERTCGLLPRSKSPLIWSAQSPPEYSNCSRPFHP